MADLSLITIDSFADTLKELISANVHSRGKGNIFKDWCTNNFEADSRIAYIKSQQQLTNRVSEQFRYFSPIVVFVCNPDVKRDTLLKYIFERGYKQLSAVAIVGVSNVDDESNADLSFVYEQLLVYKNCLFTSWAEKYFDNCDNAYALMRQLGGVQEGNKRDYITSYNSLLTAIRTKPFLILGGFSGTGKSQKVKELAYLTCPKELQNEKKPGNYSLISVKPNWHDSTELLGYESTIANKYMVTDFMRFVVKAMQYPNIPFFCCMDEMNLAPVEEYFAEYLSVLESRKKVSLIDENGNGVYDDDGNEMSHIVSEPLISADVFKKNYKENIFEDLGLKKVVRTVSANEAASVSKGTETTSEAFEREDIIMTLQRDGLCIPENLVVIGTVNMDDTTNSFSRKVIDRAMIFETDIETFDKDKYFNSEDTLQYGNVDGATFICDEVRADKAIEAGYELSEEDRQAIIDYINELNKAMAGTSFQISYRVLNEMILYYRSMEILNNGEANLEQVKNDILMMKVLPRIEGDSAAKKALVGLKTMIEKQNIPSEWVNVSYDIDAETIASKPETPWKDSILKIAYMLNLLNTGDGFTRFWK